MQIPQEKLYASDVVPAGTEIQRAPPYPDLEKDEAKLSLNVQEPIYHIISYHSKGKTANRSIIHMIEFIQHS